MGPYEDAVQAIGRGQLKLDVAPQRSETLGAELHAIRTLIDGCARALRPSDDIFDHRLLLRTSDRDGR